MAKDDRDRLSVDLRGLRSRIKTLQERNDLMREMNLAQAIRHLLVVGIETLEARFGRPPAIAELVAQWDLEKLAEESQIPVDALREIKLGNRPTDGELVDLARVLVKTNGAYWTTHELLDIRDKTFPHTSQEPEKQPNGKH